MAIEAVQLRSGFQQHRGKQRSLFVMYSFLPDMCPSQEQCTHSAPQAPFIPFNHAKVANRPYSFSCKNMTHLQCMLVWEVLVASLDHTILYINAKPFSMACIPMHEYTRSMAWLLQAYDLKPASQMLRRRVAQLVVDGHVIPVCLAWQSLDLELEPHHQVAIAKINLMVLPSPVDRHMARTSLIRNIQKVESTYICKAVNIHLLDYNDGLPST